MLGGCLQRAESVDGYGGGAAAAGERWAAAQIDARAVARRNLLATIAELQVCARQLWQLQRTKSDQGTPLEFLDDFIPKTNNAIKVSKALDETFLAEQWEYGGGGGGGGGRSGSNCSSNGSSSSSATAFDNLLLLHDNIMRTTQSYIELNQRNCEVCRIILESQGDGIEQLLLDKAKKSGWTFLEITYGVVIVAGIGVAVLFVAHPALATAAGITIFEGISGLCVIGGLAKLGAAWRRWRARETATAAERQFQDGMSHFGVVHLPDHWHTVDDVKRDLDVLDRMVSALQDDLGARAAHQGHLRAALEVFLDMQSGFQGVPMAHKFSDDLRALLRAFVDPSCVRHERESSAQKFSVMKELCANAFVSTLPADDGWVAQYLAGAADDTARGARQATIESLRSRLEPTNRAWSHLDARVHEYERERAAEREERGEEREAGIPARIAATIAAARAKAAVDDAKATFHKYANMILFTGELSLANVRQSVQHYVQPMRLTICTGGGKEHTRSDMQLVLLDNIKTSCKLEFAPRDCDMAAARELAERVRTAHADQVMPAIAKAVAAVREGIEATGECVISEDCNVPIHQWVALAIAGPGDDGRAGAADRQPAVIATMAHMFTLDNNSLVEPRGGRASDCQVAFAKSAIWVEDEHCGRRDQLALFREISEAFQAPLFRPATFHGSTGNGATPISAPAVLRAFLTPPRTSESE